MNALPSALILGVDPGTNHTGYGLIETSGARLSVIAQGRWSPRPAWPLPRRLHYIYQGLLDLVPASGLTPEAVAIEDVFYANNVRSAIRLGHARGVVMLAAAQWKAEVFEYAPAAVKSAVAGYGQAGKSQVGQMVGRLLELSPRPTADAADALAVAICHANRRGLNRLLGGLAAQKSGRSSSWRRLAPEDALVLSYKKGAED